MLTKFNLYIGLNDKDSKVQEISTLWTLSKLLTALNQESIAVIREQVDSRLL